MKHNSQDVIGEGECPKCGITPTVTGVGNFKMITCGMIGADQWFMHPLAGCPMQTKAADESGSHERRLTRQSNSRGE